MNKKKHAYLHGGAARTALYFSVALTGVLLFSLNLPSETYVNLSYFYLAHSVMEIAGILIVGMIVVVGWTSLEGYRTLRSTILSSAFFGLGIMEAVHLLTFDGYFAQTLVYGSAVSTKLARASQVFAAAGLLSFAFIPQHSVRRHFVHTIYLLTALASVAVIVFIFANSDSTTAIVENGTNLGASETGFEHGMVIIYLVAGMKLFSNSIRTNSNPCLTIATASLVLALSVIFFSRSSQLNDFSSLMGHLYKLLAYIMLFRALALKNIVQPYYDIRALEQRFESTLEALPDLVFETSIDGTFYAFHSDPKREDLIVKPVNFIGHNLSEFLSVDATTICLAALREADKKGHSYGQQYSVTQPDGEHRYEISISALDQEDQDRRFVILVRDVSIRYSLTQRIQALLSLSKSSEGLNEQDIAKLGMDKLEKLTNSKVSFLHLLSEDGLSIELTAWGSDTETKYFKPGRDQHDAPASAGIWADCIRTRAPVVVNDYPNEAGKNGLPDSHCELKRFVSVPFLDGERIAMVIGIGNSEFPYNETTVNTIEFFGNELYQMLQRRRAQNESEKNRILLTSALEYLPIGVAITTRGKQPKFEYFNQRFPALYNVDSSNLTNFESFWEAAIDDEKLRKQLLKKMYEDFKSGDPNRLNWEHVPVTGDGGTKRYLNVQSAHVPNTNFYVTFAEDVTNAIKREEETRIAATAFSSQEGILITNEKMQILRVNAAFERSIGYRSDELIGKTPAFFQSGNQDKNFYKTMWESIERKGVWRGEMINKSKEGKLAPYSLTISAVKNKLDTITHFVAHYIDLSDIKSAQSTISRLSYFDTLTGLPNREFLKGMLSAKQLTSHSADGFIGALMIDLDNFKTINETLGHESGDELLLEVSKRLKTVLRSGDKVARYGGDEFVILFMELGADEEQASLKAQLLAQSVVYSLEDTYVIGKNAYFSTASIGATLLRARNPDSLVVFQQLDIALSSAKGDGKNQIRFFDPAWQDSVNKRAHLLDELRLAIKERQLELFYQPQLNEHGKIIGCEGLIRWNHPTRGLLPPSEFLPIAQENHLMIRIGDEVLRMGLEQLHHWQQKTEFQHIQLSLNITADQFYEDCFEKQLLALLSEFSITPGSLMLEFTESMILGGVEAARKKIIRLNAADIEFAIDDFGTGYSSLSYLSTLPMDQLKIDQSFVRNIGIIETDTQIVKAIITMAKILKLGVIAEGVETQAQFDYLKSQDCELFQGYLFSRPVPVAEFDQLVLNATCEQ